MSGRVKRWAVRWFNAYAFIGLTVLTGFWLMDGITLVKPAAPAQATSGAPVGQKQGRVFILFLDSLRYQTATATDFMPYLSSLRDRAVWAEVKPSYNAITVPCVRAAFTGRDDVSILGFVQNFVHGDAAIESFFSQFAQRGGRTAVFSDGSFLQFGKAITATVTTDLVINSAGVDDYDDATVARGLKLFHEGRDDIVIVHVRYTDYAAHKYGVGGPGYGTEFRRADRLVEAADRSIGGSDTLVVMGDHGHALDGTHSLGQDIPTFALYRGPLFRKGYDIGVIDIMSHRWFLSEIFGLTLPISGYMGGRYPSVFVDSPLSVTRGLDVRLPPIRQVNPLVWCYLAFLAVFGAGLLWPERAPWMRRDAVRWLIWGLLPLALLPLPFNGLVGTLAALGILGWALGLKEARGWLLTLGLVGVALAWHEWGVFVSRLRDRLDSLDNRTIVAAWLIVGVLAALTTTARNRRWLVSALALGVVFLAVPTNNRYGFAPMMVPLLWLWAVTFVVGLAKGGRSPSGRDWGWILLMLAAIFGFTEAFAGVYAVHYTFRTFVSLISFSPLNPETLLWRGFVAQLIIFFPTWPRRWLPALLRLTLIVMLQQLQWRTWDPGPWGSLVIIAGLLAGCRVSRGRDRDGAGAFLLGLLLFLFAYCILLVRESYFWADCMFAGLVLSARLVRRFGERENARFDYVVLAAVMFLAAGFFSVQWSIQRLEWSRIYTWFAPGVVEHFAVILLPWIVLKTMIPLMVGRYLLVREMGPAAQWPGDILRRIGGFKVLTLLLVITGIGLVGTVSNVYLEGAQQLTVLLILWFGIMV